MQQVRDGMKEIAVLEHQLRDQLLSHVNPVVSLFQLPAHLEPPLVFAQMRSHQRMHVWSPLIMGAARTLRR